MASARACVPLISAWVVLALLLAGPAANAGDWAMYGGSAGHGFSNDATPPSSLGRIWTFAGNTTANGTLGSAAVVGDYVYVADVDRSPPPSGPNVVVHRIHAANGSDSPSVDAWWSRISVPNAIAIAPPRALAVDVANVYALYTVNRVGTNEHQEILVALDAATGAVRWRLNSTSHALAVPTMSAPVVGPDFIAFGSQDGGVYAANSTGAPLWWTDVGAPVQSVPALGSGATSRIVYVTAGTELLYLDRGASGAIVQRVDLGVAIPTSPAADGSYAYVDAGGVLRAYDGLFPIAPLWTFAAAGESASTPAFSGTNVVARRTTGLVFAVGNGTSGELQWARGNLVNVTAQSDVAAADGRIFLAAGATTHDLVVLDTTTGGILDRNSDGTRPTLGAPVVAGTPGDDTSKVYVSEGARLTAYRGRPDVSPASITPNLAQVEGGVARGSVRIVIRNDGGEAATSVVVRVYDGAADPANLIGTFVVGNASQPLKGNGGLSAGNGTADQDWTVGTHSVRVVIDAVDQEANFANNEAVAFVTVRPGPPETIVVGTGPYWAALLLGFLVGVAVLYFPMRRLRELRRKERESEASPEAEAKGP